VQFRWALPLAVAACSAAPEAPGPSVPAQLVLIRRLVIDLPGVSGLSDLAVDETGRVWSVAERVRTAVRIDWPGAAPVAVPLVGIPDGVDVEGLAWLDRDRVAMATEADIGMRTSDAVLLARLGPAGLVVYERRDLDYAIWPLEPVVVAELTPVMAHQENFEGLIWDGARAVSLVVDNDWTHVTGPNLLVEARLDGRLPAAH
jgi:hypothetical protein